MRTALTLLLPLLAPTLLYVAWLVLRSRRGQPPPLRHPWLWLVGSGVVFLVVAMGARRMSDGTPPGGRYVPAHLEDGRIVEGETVRPPLPPPNPAR